MHILSVVYNMSEVSFMVNENEYYNNQSLPHYQFQQPQATQMPVHYNGMYDPSAYYYNPYINGGYPIPPQMNGMNGTQPSYYSNQPSEGITSTSVMQQFLDENGDRKSTRLNSSHVAI